MNKDLRQRVAEMLTEGLAVEARTAVEARYRDRGLSTGAEVTRFAPSPTGFVHIGAIFTALICQRVAAQSDGVYILRIEDTDKKREVEGSLEQITSQLAAFNLAPDEGPQADDQTIGDYGPYIQSERQKIYLAYALDLL